MNATAAYWGFPETDGGASSCKGVGFVSACDEFPWQATEQGGEFGRPLPHLKIIDWAHNNSPLGSQEVAPLREIDWQSFSSEAYARIIAPRSEASSPRCSTTSTPAR